MLARLADRAPSPARPQQIADHVRRARRAAADRMGGAVAAGLRELAARAHRQCRAQPAPARRVRRGHGRAAPGAARRPRHRSRPAGTCRCEILKHLEKIWREPDEGIWEVRSGREHFTYSKAMAWVAFDRAIKSARDVRAAGAGRRTGASCATHIHDDVCAHGYDHELGSFVRAYGSKELDASLLLLPAIGFLPPDDPRIRGTVEAIERDLIADGFVRRYDTRQSRRRPAGRRGRVPRLQLLARRRLSDARPARRGARRCSSGC